MFTVFVYFLMLAILMGSIPWCESYQRIASHSSHLRTFDGSRLSPKVDSTHGFITLRATSMEETSNSEMQSHAMRSISWAAAATGFAAVLAVLKGQAAAVEFSSGYLLELCLSVDNLFAFLILFDYFKVKPDAQEKILNYGIGGAIVLRGLFIAAGSVAISQFHDVLLVFAGILAYSAYSIFFGKEDEDEEVMINH